MKHKLLFAISLITICIFNAPIFGQSIAEKKAALSSSEGDLDKDTEQTLIQVNKETDEIKARIKGLYSEAYQLYSSGAPEDQYKSLLEQINTFKKQLTELEEFWREVASKSGRTEVYGLWHAPETTLEQLIIDYGSLDYVYLIPPEIASMPISIDSNLPIPRASWGEMLELILTQNGVGVQTLNSYLRQLYFFKENSSNLKMITNKRKDLEILPSDARISFVLSPEPSEVRRSYVFLEKFYNSHTTLLHVLGRDILLIGPVSDIQDLLKLYDFIGTNRGDKDYRIVPLQKVQAEEMARILAAIFDQSAGGSSSPGGSELKAGQNGGSTSSSFSDANGIKVIVLKNIAQALFIVGTREEVRKAEEIVNNVEEQIGGAREKSIFWYTVKHSDTEELAELLYRVYNLMIATNPVDINRGQGSDDNDTLVIENNIPPPGLPMRPQLEPPLLLYGEEGYYQEGGFLVNPAPAQPGIIPPQSVNQDRNNFIVDVKTGSIVMVVEMDILEQLKELLKKLDVPKKMVQIETLLFEKVINRQNNFGLNLLKIGDFASQTHFTGAVFNNIFPNGKDFVPENRGVFEYFISRKTTSSGFPAFDLAYRFLLSQDDIQINSSPSILTMNQTPATISINEDISINTGIFEVETAKGVTLKDAFTRAQYGITISIKPTIHMRDDDNFDCELDENYDYVTLESDITFDTIHGGGNPSRPDVTRRHITNMVQVPDGETVVLGGLRRKISNDMNETIPFIGELPGIGKLFSQTALKDNSTEMFIFITPRIVKDPKDQLRQLRQDLLCLRPGDTPYFLECVQEASEYERTRLMQGSMTLLFGRPTPRYYIQNNLDECCGEYDGR